MSGRYSSSQGILISHYEKKNHIPLFIRNIITNRPSYIPLYVQLSGDKDYSTKSIAESFDTQNYNDMSRDKTRVEFYNSVIKDVYTDKSKWLEVGPGSDICLSKLLLESRPDAFYFGVEVNKAAYKKVKSLLRPYKNASVFNGFVDRQTFTKFPPEIDFILHEIFGTISSLEGVGQVMSVLKQRYPNAKSVPEYTSTHLVPLQLDIQDIIKDPTLIVNDKLFRGRIPFDKSKLSSPATLEYLNFNENFSLTQSHTTRCVIEKDGVLNVIGIYIVIGHEKHIITSKCDLPNYSESWSNIGLVLSEEIPVKKNKMCTIISNIDLDSLTPKYSITMKYEKFEQTWTITPGDLCGDYRYLHTIHETIK